jgi:hypothetical protein
MVLRTSTAKKATATLRDRRTNESITRMLLRKPVCTSGGTYGRSSLTRIASNATTTAR